MAPRGLATAVLAVLAVLVAVAKAEREGGPAQAVGRGVRFCDKRLKENVTAADTDALLEAIDNVQLREFDFVHKQFYNPIFGKRQLGIIAQELLEVYPRAIGTVPKRTVGAADTDEPLVLENVHVFNTEPLFMANVGATQRLSGLTRQLQGEVRKVLAALDETSANAKSGVQAHEEVQSLKSKQEALESMAREAHERSAATVKIEETMTALAKESETERVQRLSLEIKLQEIEKLLAQEVQEQSGLHRDLAVSAGQTEAALQRVDEQLAKLSEAAQLQRDEAKAAVESQKQELGLKGAALDELRTLVNREVEALTSSIASHHNVLEEHTAQFDAAKGDIKSAGDRVNAFADELSAMRRAQDAATKELVEQHKALNGQLAEDLASVEVSLFKQGNESKARLNDVEKRLTEVQLEIEQLWERVERQAAQELVEKRLALEAQVNLEEAKIELERVRGEEQRKTAIELAEIEEAKQRQQHNVTLERIKREEAIRAERDLKVLEAKEASERRQIELQTEQEKTLQKARADAEMAKLEVEARIAKDTALATAQAETQRERENHDLRMEMARLEAEEGRQGTRAAINAAVDQALDVMRLAASSPEQVLGGIGMLVVFALGVFAAREAMVLVRKYWELRLGRPSLVRETSMGTPLLLGLFQALCSRTRLVEHLTGLRVRFLGSLEEKAAWEKTVQQRQEAARSFRAFMQDVILPAAQTRQVDRIARATRAAHETESALRHVLFYGPPGTGKTMVARHLSKWCDLDYAIMSGADVAPLKDSAVTEVHNLFKWANSTRRGVVLFIDEADAFLASRDGAGAASETLRNALTALLFHTGGKSSKVMMVLATNRPGDLDRAIVDRIDESVQFGLPSLPERRLLVAQYFALSVAGPLEMEPGLNVNNLLEDTALRTEGFSGREISKLMTSVQAHVYGSEANSKTLTQSLYAAVLEHVVQEHNKLGDMARTKFSFLTKN
ncbi:ATPase family AAA domain-containing protein 3 [Durusdinium trenchii]|uniref:ATPase family AAA domain-containing protein 3 n=1 Tax=Durusdinium trenchii TaxID=1381693 RepID=A0ABP0RIV5_9DINO